MAIDPTGNLKREDLTGFNEGHDSECWMRLGAIETTVHDRPRRDLGHPLLGVGA